MENPNNQTTYLVVDGENIDATLGLSVLDRRPNPEERPRWDRVLESAHGRWGQKAKGLFFLNGSSGFLPMGFVQALTAMDYSVIPLSGPADMKVVDVGLQRTMDAIAQLGTGDVILASHDADAHPGLRQASLAARSQLRSLAHIAYGTDDPHAEVTLWAYIHGLATLVLDGPPALGSGQDAQCFARQAIESPFFIDGVTGA